MSTRSLALAVAATLLAAACGDDSEGVADDSSVSSSQATGATTPTGTDSQPPASSVGAESNPAVRTVTDALGNEVDVPATPLRIASMDLYTTTRLLELGFHPVVSGVPDPDWELSQEHLDAWAQLGFDNSLLEHETLPYGGEYNIEAIAAAAPDLIVGQPAYIDSIVEQLAGIAPVVQWDSGVLPLVEQIEAVANLVGAEGQASDIADAFEERMAGISDGIELGSIALVDNNVYDGVFYLYGEGGGITVDWSDRLGVDVVAPVDVELDPTGGAYVSTENIPTLDDADAVVIFGEPLLGEPLREDTLFQRLDATEAGSICDAGNFNLVVGLHGLDEYAAQLERVAACLGQLSTS
ncbi:MAG: ABC transporter substrate-binding protein [Actinomycetota bacterium]